MSEKSDEIIENIARGVSNLEEQLKRIAAALEKMYFLQNPPTHRLPSEAITESAGEKKVASTPSGHPEALNIVREKELPTSKPAPPKLRIKKKGPYKIANKPCNTCGQTISWDLYPDRATPLHVNIKGFIRGDGNCPDYVPEEED